ncbi:hypothetical protein [Kribbella jiaozuonensis]|uniref:Uncharacterized protein n=1 Tax=Kribbella jiaozuonensis TaxID=2575441 RepID=A0A4U3LTI3_9ACTN|nr:hypothetical protein [Kribbella jiaozuonensis]TKK79358.1 hypothetical protein FDA38_13145 [Kribbella jiaozuonensis]
MAKFLGFLLGVAVALAGPAVFGVLAAPGGIELNAKELALAFGIGALVFWAVVSYFSGAAALGAFLAFGVQVYCWLWIPNRTTNFLNDVPGVTTGMIDGSKQYTLNGVVPILGVISLVYGIQLIVRSVQKRRRVRVEEERLQREQEAAQAQQEADVAAVYPVAGSTYAEPVPYESHSRYDDLFDEPEPVQPRNQADEQTRQFPLGAEFEQTRQFPEDDARGNYVGDETVATSVPEDAADQDPEQEQAPAQEEPVAEEAPAAEAKPVEETQAAPVEETQAMPVAENKPAESKTPDAEVGDETQAMPVDETQAMPATETTPAEVKAPEVKAEEAAPAEVKAAEAKAEEAAPAKPQQAQGERPKAAEFSGKEQVGSQYRERMEDPEDTGEFYLAFENPVVKPA